jgi:hypothetical protein
MEVEEEAELEEKEEEKTVMAEDRRRGPRTGGSREAGPSRPDWLGGKMVNGYSFARDDLRVSNRPPNGECYICTSPKHMAWDCTHYGRWLVLKQAMLIHVDLDSAEEEKEHLDYIAVLVESKNSSSDYSSDSSKCSESHKHVLTVDALDCDAKAAHVEYKGFNRNHRLHDAFQKAKSSSDKGKAVKGDDPAKLPRRILRKAAHVAELPSSTDSEGLTIYEACKVRQLPDGLGSLGARPCTSNSMWDPYCMK